MSKASYARRRGFTLTEAVVSMALVLLITGAVTTAILAALRLSDRRETQAQALRACDNLLTCYQSEDMAAGLALLLGPMAPDGWTATAGASFCVLYTADGQPTQAADQAKFQITATLTAAGDRGLLLELTAAAAIDGEVLYELSYTKP